MKRTQRGTRGPGARQGWASGRALPTHLSRGSSDWNMSISLAQKPASMYLRAALGFTSGCMITRSSSSYASSR